MRKIRKLLRGSVAGKLAGAGVAFMFVYMGRRREGGLSSVRQPRDPSVGMERFD